VTGQSISIHRGFVSTILSAGFHVELAGGGHYNAVTLCAKVTETQSKIPPGVSITLNSLYINPQQFSTGDWLRRVEERFAGVNGGAEASVCIGVGREVKHCILS